MSDPASHFHPVPRWPGFVLAVFAAVGISAAALAAVESASGPTIRRVDIGIQNHFKVGSWTPVRVEVDGLQGLREPRVEVTVADSDGVPTTASALLRTAGSDQSHGEAIVYTAVGRVGNAIHVSLVDGDKQLTERILHSAAKAKTGIDAVALPATAEWIVALGQQHCGISEAFPNRESGAGQLARQVFETNRVADLPSEWFGYEGVDLLLISAGDGSVCRQLSADGPRFHALSRWVELGGTLVVMCGGPTARDIFANGKPLSRFAPGKLAEVVPLRSEETGPIEHFAGSAPTITEEPNSPIRMPRYTEVQGNIEVYAGKLPSDLPIVVRSPYGLGEVAFVGLDLGQPPLANWPGRAAFLQALLRPYLANITSLDVSQRLVTRGYDDVAGALRQQLGKSFVSVAPIGFGAIAGMTIVYLFFLGPLDYLLVNRWLRRSWLAWVSFPLLVLLFCAGAMALAKWHSGRQEPRANQLELIDIDTINGRTRGTLWATIFSPEAKRFDLGLNGPSRPSDAKPESNMLLTWWGLPGVGIGGMQSGGFDLGIVHAGYRYAPEGSSLENVPILASATKSLLARWTTPDAPAIAAKLTDQDGLAVGSITNQSGIPLRNVRLLYGTWAYRLGTLGVGQRINVDEQLSPRKVKTIVTHDVLNEANSSQALEENRFFAPEQATPKEILNLMMFYEAAGGFSFAHLPNQYQSYCDLSRLLDLGRAMLVADADQTTVRLSRGDAERSTSDKDDTSTVIYRFVLPVDRQSGH
ncbi:MAG TPA: hypothetical protein VFW73_01440 [Lacipirellulaceae bacterium]|nr:hypothetical protein [Lacipirellulaceae bacterium]